jgi:3-methyladenine DNA glycosylase AlkD
VPDIGSVAADIEAQLRAGATPERAVNEKRYLKSDLEFIGATVPATRSAVKAAFASEGSLSRDELLALVDALWVRGIHELRMASVEALDLQAKLLLPQDIGLIERLIRESKTWALVDGLAATVAGGMVERYPELGETLDRWAVDEDFWVRRASMLALLGPLRRGEGDWERFTRYADSMLEEKEFFIRKAIGWVLRETSKKRPDLVYEWLLPRAPRCSGVTLREAVRYLSADQSTSVLNQSRRITARPE